VYDQTMVNLVVRKDLLNYAQSRAYYATKICFSIMPFYGLTVGINIWSFPGSTFQSPALIMSALPGYYNGLYKANHNIINLVNEINDENLRNELFIKDVRSFGSIYDLGDQSEYNQTQFEIVELLVGATKHLMKIPTIGDVTSRPVIEYIRRSTETDFFAKNSKITDLFQSSVDKERQNLSDIIVVCLIVTPILLIGVTLVLTGIIWRQYSEETAYLRAFTKLDPITVKAILKDFEAFKNVIISDVSFEDKRMIEFFWEKSISMEAMQMRTHHSKHETQVLEYFKLTKRYFLYVVQVLIYVGILIVILLWNFLSARYHSNIIYNLQSQLQLSNFLSEKVSIAVQAVAELYQTADTLDFIHTSPKQYIENSLAELKGLQTQMVAGFLGLDKSYDPQVEAILFSGKPCAEYVSFYAGYCTALENQGVLTNSLNLMSYVLTLFESKYEKYDRTNKTSLEALYREGYQGVGLMVVSTSLFAYQAQLMNEIINENLAKSISQASKQQETLLAMFVVCLTFVSFLIWIRILKKIKEVRNDFKRVLQVLPPKLVLSSFLLKQFLSKASGMIQSN